MWRFINSIPRAFRQCHGPRASVGVHVDEGEQELQTGQEICLHERRDVKEHSDVYGTSHCGCDINEEPTEFKRKTSLIRSVLLGWNPRHGTFFGHYTGHGERTKQEKEEQWWKACRHDLCALLNRNHLLEILTLGSYCGQSTESNRHTAKKRLLYRVLFSLSKDNNALYITGNKVPAQLSLPCPCDENQQDASQHVPKAHKSESSPINADNDEESIDSALQEFQDICKEYSSKSESLLGLEAAKNGDMADALLHMKKACSMGNTSACFNIGLCYETGFGVTKDLDKAVEYYQKAANLGHTLAMYNLGLIYLNDDESDQDSLRQRGVLFIEKAAKAGLSEAQTQMGILCMEQDNARDASKYFKAAADQSDCEAQYFLGLCYEQGLGVDVDLERAVQLYSLASSAGHEDATYNLAVLTELGLAGITADQTAVADLYKKAADAGHSLAKARLQKLAAEREEEKSRVVERKRKWKELEKGLNLSLEGVDSGYSSLSSSSSSPDLSRQYTDITSLLFSGTASDKIQPFSTSSDPKQQSMRRNSGVFYVGENSDIFGQRDLDLTLTRGDSRRLGYENASHSLYGHFHKSHTSPNLPAMLASS